MASNAGINIESDPLKDLTQHLDGMQIPEFCENGCHKEIKKLDHKLKEQSALYEQRLVEQNNLFSMRLRVELDKQKAEMEEHLEIISKNSTKKQHHQRDMMPHQNMVYPTNYSQGMGSASNVQYATNMPMAYGQPGFHQPQQYGVRPQGYPMSAQHQQQAQPPQQSMNSQIAQAPAPMAGYPGQYPQAHMHTLNQAAPASPASPSAIEKPPPSVPPQSSSSSLPKETAPAPAAASNPIFPSYYVDTTGQDMRIAAQFKAQVSAAAASSSNNNRK